MRLERGGNLFVCITGNAVSSSTRRGGVRTDTSHPDTKCRRRRGRLLSRGAGYRLQGPTAIATTTKTQWISDLDANQPSSHIRSRSDCLFFVFVFFPDTMCSYPPSYPVAGRLSCLPPWSYLYNPERHRAETVTDPIFTIFITAAETVPPTSGFRRHDSRQLPRGWW